LGLVYLPSGNSTPDYYGAHRSAVADQFSSSVIALDAATGELRWSFQTVHHDLWDYDVSSQPTLIDLADGTPALLQPTKRGELFLLNRRTGQPIAAVEERAVPQGGAPGERIAPTQPFSVGMASLAGPMPMERRMWGVTPFDQLWCRIKYLEARFEGTLTPLGEARPTIVYPGYTGGSDWGGISVDLDRGVLIANTNQIWNYDQLISRAEADKLGLKPFSAASHGDVGGPTVQAGTPYAVSVKPFMSPLTVPCNQPPYGLLSALDLKTGKLLWSKPFGTAEDSGPLNIPTHLPFTLGAPNFGGSVVTRGGVLFVGATLDHYLRAYETGTGRELWRGRLPNGGQATPMVYWSDKSEREVVVIAAGGHYAMLSPPGDYIVAYALPKHL
jgi:quinoprotein glucose dehydrogenase